MESDGTPTQSPFQLARNRSVTDSVANSEVLNFADLIAQENLTLAGRRVSGIRRARYSYTEHFNAWKKFGRFAINILKLFILVFAYLLVEFIEVKQEADVRRRRWTLDVLYFYNILFLVAICLGLTMKFVKNQALLVTLLFLSATTVVVFAYNATAFFIRGWNILEGLPDEESREMPAESTLLYFIYIVAFSANLVLLIIFIYMMCYMLVLTYQLRGVIFDNDTADQNMNLRLARQASNMRRLESLKNHRKPMINSLFVRSDTTCIVCIGEFTEEEEIVVLECHESHIYHYDCIENWIARGNRECPVCRTVINFPDEA